MHHRDDHLPKKRPLAPLLSPLFQALAPTPACFPPSLPSQPLFLVPARALFSSPPLLSPGAPRCPEPHAKSPPRPAALADRPPSRRTRPAPRDCVLRLAVALVAPLCARLLQTFLGRIPSEG